MLINADQKDQNRSQNELVAGGPLTKLYDKVAYLLSPPVGRFLFSPSGFIEQGLLTVFAIQSSKNTDNALDLSDCFDHKRTWINTYENPFVNHLNH